MRALFLRSDIRTCLGMFGHDKANSMSSRVVSGYDVEKLRNRLRSNRSRRTKGILIVLYYV